MALVACPDCGTQVSDAAAACPKCARPISQRLPAQAPAPSVSQNVMHNVVVNVGNAGAPQRQWSPFLAGFLSFIVPGLGQMYKGQVVNGLVWFVAVVAGYLVIVPGLILHLLCVIGAATGDPNAGRKTSPLVSGLGLVLVVLIVVGMLAKKKEAAEKAQQQTPPAPPTTPVVPPKAADPNDDYDAAFAKTADADEAMKGGNAAKAYQLLLEAQPLAKVTPAGKTPMAAYVDAKLDAARAALYDQAGDAATKGDLAQARDLYAKLGGWKDAAAKVAEIDAKLAEKKKWDDAPK